MRVNHQRRQFIGGSDARIIIGGDEAALLRLWKEKRGEVEPVDLSGNLIVQLGTATEQLNRHWDFSHRGARLIRERRERPMPHRRARRFSATSQPSGSLKRRRADEALYNRTATAR